MLDLKLKSMILSLSLGLILSSSLAWPMNQAEPSQAQAWTLFVGLYQAQAKLEHSIFAVELSLNIYYSTKLSLFTALVFAHKERLIQSKERLQKQKRESF